MIKKLYSSIANKSCIPLPTLQPSLVDTTSVAHLRAGILEAEGTYVRVDKADTALSRRNSKPTSERIHSRYHHNLENAKISVKVQQLAFWMNHQLSTPREINRDYIPVPLQQTASMTPPPPYVPLPPGIAVGSPRPNHGLPHGQYPALHPQRQLPGPTNAPIPPHAIPTHQQTFGPTPISTSLPLLPYAFYESSEAAAARARWRFVSAVMLALSIYLFVAAVVGLELLGEMAGGFLAISA